MKNTVKELKHSEAITVTDSQGNAKTFHVNIGDALLNGNGQQIWLKHDNSNNVEYLRKLPVKPMSVGTALFSSFNDLLNTLDSGNFYFG
ncbi:hypothetical protein KKA14_17215 [bacterium]|nr:hypothetical protein [bacterium]